MPSLFDVTHQDKTTAARAGVIHTDHGDIQTPVFMPVGTQATVKSLDSRDIHELGADVILANTYHLHLRPGEKLISSFGGLHKFMQWDRPILTDSGGFQVFSLGRQRDRKKTIEASDIHNPTQGRLVTIDEDGVTFRSHIDGSEHRFTPESAIDIQHHLGADIIMAFDECTPDDADTLYTQAAMDRTHRWAARCIDQHQKHPGPHVYRQFLFGIIQGANHEEFRKKSAEIISSLPFDGIAIGGESIGYNMSATTKILDWVVPLLPPEKPRYTMGLGFSPLDLFDAVEHGADMFDCVSPTRMARNGALFVHPQTYRDIYKETPSRNLRIAITNAGFATDINAIDPRCACSTCTTYSRAYLHHLFEADELLAYRLATIHNVHFFLSLIREIRDAILHDQFTQFKNSWQSS